jgi:3-hydroxybutyryl-CoA dehydrogenase
MNTLVIDKAKTLHAKVFERQVEKQTLTETEMTKILERITYTNQVKDLVDCELVIEAIIEDLSAKHTLFSELESLVSDTCILASNTSSLSIASIGSVLKKADRILGIHFFNPAPLMPLVEIIPAVQTANTTLQKAKQVIAAWGKTGVVCKDTPGFIVNRVARPFYGEALRIYDEGIADFATIDWAMTHIGGFKMGPFTLMDFIGNDINYAVTESVFSAFYFDPRFKPSLTQKRYREAGYLGRKSGRGYYVYSEGVEFPKPVEDEQLGKMIFKRILAMLINEAVDAVFMQVASPEAVDLAMTKGVNYPKGLLKWADELGLEEVLLQLEDLYAEYGEDRYRPNPLLRRMVRENKCFFS